MRAYERLLDYVKIYTTSDDNSETMPSSVRQFDLAHQLVSELKKLGIENAEVDEKCCVYGWLPATEGYENVPKIALIAHMDTAPDFCGENVKPCIIENYNGQDVILGDSGRVLSVDRFPHLPSLKGRTLIVTDGTTLLGADDKAGIAEIMTVVEMLNQSRMPHGGISIAFTPDEEVGRGADAVDLKKLNADYGYTIDGGVEGEITYENFNACSAHWTINGFNVHPGSSKNTMVNALLVAFEINSMLPSGDTPANTEGYEGFFHLTDMHGNVERAEMSYIIRDHSEVMYAARQETLRHIEKLINERYGDKTAILEIHEQYKNMVEKIRPVMHLIDNAVKAAETIGITPVIEPIRGGTDGARLSFEGLPCPDLGTGGFAYHGPYEHITAEGMDQSVALIMEILRIYAEGK